MSSASTDPMQRARDLLAAEYGSHEPGMHDLEAEMMLQGIGPALGALTKALTREEEVPRDSKGPCEGMTVEFRPDSKGRFDEIVIAKPDMVHFEMMTKGSLYIGHYGPGDQILQVWVHAEKGKLVVYHETNCKAPPAIRGRAAGGGDQ